ncbi:hypothetical protein CPB83DRAFT_777022 [Crepidotus variabilis]|uniref:DUF6534 domain-containing protein n=1 Tax=Crepidotus variabilis TaxID=179855 RepID=A0A9P6E4N7_9AGAR|nr:hypothetical protein CPB83DRAFT_777022 [Crepidotus variabilis]
MFWGLFLNVLLMGVMITQVYLYYVTYKRSDKLWIKLFVSGLSVVDCLNTAFDLAFLYDALIIKFGDVQSLQKTNWRKFPSWKPRAVIGMSVQLFFAWRIYTLTKSPIWPGIIGAVALLCGATGIVTGYKVVQVGYFSQFRKFKSIVIVSLLSAAVDDAIITVILVLFLCQKHKSGYKRSDLMVNRIVRFTVQTGLMTVIFAILNLVFYLADPSGIHLLFNFPIPKLYSNSVMSGLNSRRAWRQANESGDYGTGFESQPGSSTFRVHVRDLSSTGEEVCRQI